MPLQITRPRGTSDILPEETPRWQYVECVIRDLCRTYGFGEIRTPAFEHTELFQRGVGEGTDIVEKEMYTFTDKGGRSLTLRPEGTASVVRAYLENNLHTQGGVAKFYYLAPMFRYERPQAGRLRQHHQFGVEVFGAAEPSADAEVICLAMDLFTRLGLVELEVHINSLGCPTCRQDYRERLRAYFTPRLAELCPDCQRRFTRNPLRLIDCKNEACRLVAAEAPTVLDFLCDGCRDHFTKLQEYLRVLGIRFSIDPHIVRGLDYYTRTVFEVIHRGLGAQSTVCGGGRYDGLIETIGGPPTPGVGFGLGLERLLLTLEQAGLSLPGRQNPDVFLVTVGGGVVGEAMPLAHQLRQAGWVVEMDHTGRSVKAQMKQADRLGAVMAVLLGEEELAQGVVTLRMMQTGEEVRVPLKEVGERVSSLLRNGGRDDGR